jgi:hypothetical protein
MHEKARDCGCGCGGGSCECGLLPAEFIRVRYYYGQRLGVMELNDQALYHAGKMAFHNARLHGSGVVCGLRAEREKPIAPATQSTVLRVSAGAALDPCGREIVVGVDQCIDVAAWFAKHRTRPDLEAWVPGKAYPLLVAIRYRECPSDPGPAPRDPCGCDNGGCEYGRVREAFELGLFTRDEKICSAPPFPSAADLFKAFNRSDSANGFDPAVDTLLASACSRPGESLWLCLAAFEVTLDTTPVPVDLSAPDNAIPDRRTLLPTHALQSVLLTLAADSAALAPLGGGPRAGALAFNPDPANPTTAGTVTVHIRLARAGDPPADVPLVGATFNPATVIVSRLDATGWTDMTPVPGVAYFTTPPRIEIKFTQDLAAATPFVIAFDPPPATPTVDSAGRPLRPFTRSVRFVLDSAGALALDPAV